MKKDRQTGKFYIYGAGVFAFQTMLALYEKKGQYPEAFVTSDEAVQTDIAGIPVISIGALSKQQLQCRFIVAAPEIYHREIMKKLAEYGCENIHCICMDEENQLMGEYLGKIYHLKMISECTVEELDHCEKVYKEKAAVYMARSRKDKPLGGIYTFPDYVYPVWAGGKDMQEQSGLSDHTGETISHKNPDYCELTVTYWVWKNRTDDYKGICHYRRIFDVSEPVLLQALENKPDLIVPYPYVCSPNAGGQISRYVSKEDFKALQMAIQEAAPEYVAAFKEMCSNPLFYNYNMLIARRNIFDDYAEYLFRVLDCAEKYCLKNGKPRNDRYAGYLGEVLTSLYIFVHKDRYHILHAPWRWLV